MWHVRQWHVHTVQMPSSSIFGEYHASWCTRHNGRGSAWTVSNSSPENNLPTELGPESNLFQSHQFLHDWWHGTQVECQETWPSRNYALARPTVSMPKRVKRSPFEDEELHLSVVSVGQTKEDGTCAVTSTFWMVFSKRTPLRNREVQCNAPTWCCQSSRRVNLSEQPSIARVRLHHFLAKCQGRHQNVCNDVCGNHLDSTLYTQMSSQSEVVRGCHISSWYLELCRFWN